MKEQKMNINPWVLRAAVYWLLGSGLVSAQEAPAYFRLVDQAAGFYHPSVDKEMFSNRSARNQRKNDIGKVCGGTAPLRDNQQAFDTWFRGYFFPQLTDPVELANLSKLRRELYRDYFSKMKNDPAGLQVREHLNKLTLGFLQKLASVNTHPAVRYNAMLIIGDLDARAAETTGGAKPAEPMYEALETLQNELVSPTQIDAVRVAALLGLKRHAELNRLRPADKQWTEAQMSSLAQKVGQIAAANKPPTGRSADGHVWMRRLALETLTELAATRPLPAAASLVDRIIRDSSEPLDLRTAAAKAQGRLKSPLPMGVKPAEAAEKIAQLGVDAAIAELDSLKTYLDHLEREAISGAARPELAGSGLIGGGLGILEGSDGSGKPEEVKIIRDPLVAASQRRLKSRLEQLRHGLVGEDGASGLAAAGDEPVIDKLVASVLSLQQTVDKAPGGDPVTFDDLQLFCAELSTKADALEELLPRVKPAEEPAAPAGPAVDGPAADVGPVP